MASKFWLDGSNNRYYLGVPFTFNAIQYTPTGATSATFSSLSFTEVTVAAKPDTRFYEVSGPNNDGSWTSTDIPIAELKAKYVAQQDRVFRENTTGYGTLHELVFAFKDSGTLPADYTQFLGNCKTFKDANCVKINAVANNAAMEALINAPKWVLVDPADPADGYELNSATYLEPQPLTPIQASLISGTISIVRNGADLTSALIGDADLYYANIDGVNAYDLTAVSDNTPGTTLSYSMPNGFSGTGTFPATGTSNLNLKYYGQTIGTFAVTDATTAQSFTFGNQY